MNEIPQYVILALAFAREDGSYNMLDRRGVTHTIAMASNDDIEGFDDFDVDDAVEWLDENPKRYMEALNAMGEYIVAQRGQT